MNTANYWLYSLNDIGTQGLIVDAEGFYRDDAAISLG